MVGAPAAGRAPVAAPAAAAAPRGQAPHAPACAAPPALTRGGAAPRRLRPARSGVAARAHVTHTRRAASARARPARPPRARGAHAGLGAATAAFSPPAPSFPPTHQTNKTDTPPPSQAGLATESVHVDFEAFAQRHAETERQFKEIKRALEGLREGSRAAAASLTSAASAFASASSSGQGGGGDPAGLAARLADAADAVEDRCRGKSEASLGAALAQLQELLSSMADKSKFEKRKQLLLDLDSYKRKVKDLREKEASGGKVDLHTLRDKEDKLRAAERAFSDANDELLDEMQAVQDAKAAAVRAPPPLAAFEQTREPGARAGPASSVLIHRPLFHTHSLSCVLSPPQVEGQMVAAATAAADFFGGAGRACVPALSDAVAAAKANPTKVALPPRGGGRAEGAFTTAGPTPADAAAAQGAGAAAGFKAAQPFGAPAPAAGDPFAPPAAAAAAIASDPFAAPPAATAIVAASAAAPAAAGGAGAGGSAANRGAAEVRQATFDYTATEPGELTFAKGDRIDVLAPDESGWWQGRNARTGATGAFPVNYSVQV